jgi:phosphohistidine phosphatase SixA
MIARHAAASCRTAVMLLAAILYLTDAHRAAGQTETLQALWAAIRQPGHVVLMRHALAPGTGDPANFRLGDCATQRNLSEAGRSQARRTGEAFRTHGIASAAIYSSQWCRCLETARLLGLGEVRELPSLNSFFGDSGQAPEATRQLNRDLAAMDLSAPVILVTHQVNITAFAGGFASSGEMVVMRRKADGGFETLGTIDPLPAR